MQWLRSEGFTFTLGYREDECLRQTHLYWPHLNPMGHACFKGHMAACEELYAKGASVNCGNETGDTPLLWACWTGRLEICAWLKSKGATLRQRNDQGFSPMYAACEGGHVKVCAWLAAQGADDDVAAVVNGTTLLTVAAFKGHVKMCQWLLDQGLSPHRADAHGRTPMHVACENGHLRVAIALHKAGAAVDPLTTAGRSPLIMASLKGQLVVCKWLLAQGAALRRVDNSALTTPLAGAFRNGYVEVVKWLLLEGCLSRDGNNAFDQAAAKRDLHADPFCVATRLLAWAHDALQGHACFLHVLLRASVMLPAAALLQPPPWRRCLLPKLPRVIFQRVATFLGVETDSARLRRVRQMYEYVRVWKTNGSFVRI